MTETDGPLSEDGEDTETEDETDNVADSHNVVKTTAAEKRFMAEVSLYHEFSCMTLTCICSMYFGLIKQISCRLVRALLQQPPNSSSKANLLTYLMVKLLTRLQQTWHRPLPGLSRQVKYHLFT